MTDSPSLPTSSQQALDVKRTPSDCPTPLNEESKAGPEASLPDSAPLDLYNALSTRQLIVFGIAQLMLWAIIAANILETSFILPIVASEFNISASKVQWVAASNMLAWGSFQLIGGRLCDIFGRKRGYIIGCSAYALFNLVSTFMPNLASLNIARALVGVGAAVGLPASAGLIGSLYRPGRPRTLAYAAISCGGCAGAATGNLLVGLFVGHTRWTWRPCYFSCGLAALIPLAVGWYLVPSDPAIKRDWSIDWLGATSIGVSIFLLLFSLTISNTSSRGWKTSYLPALLVASALCLGLFVWRQRSLHRAPPNAKKPPAIAPKGLLSWKNRNLCVIYIGVFLLWGSTDGIYPFISYLYSDILKLDAFQAGLRWSAVFFSGVPAAIIVALTISKIPPRTLMSAGVLISTMTPLLFAIRKLDWPYYRGDLWAFSLAAYGADGCIAAGSSLISHTASPEDQSVASALLGTAMRLGFAVGLAICTAIQSSFEKRELHHGRTAEQAALTGLRAAFWTCVVYMVLAFLTFLLGMKGWDCIHDDGDLKHPAVSSQAQGPPTEGRESKEVA